MYGWVFRQAKAHRSVLRGHQLLSSSKLSRAFPPAPRVLYEKKIYSHLHVWSLLSLDFIFELPLLVFSETRNINSKQSTETNISNEIDHPKVRYEKKKTTLTQATVTTNFIISWDQKYNLL